MNHSGRRVQRWLMPDSRSARRHVKLKGVNELVTNDVVGLVERPRQRQDDAAPHRFGHAAGALTQLVGDDVGLLEIGVRAVQDERLAARQPVLEHPLEPRVPPFGEARGDVDAFAFAA